MFPVVHLECMFPVVHLECILRRESENDAQVLSWIFQFFWNFNSNGILLLYQTHWSLCNQNINLYYTCALNSDVFILNWHNGFTLTVTKQLTMAKAVKKESKVEELPLTLRVLTNQKEEGHLIWVRYASKHHYR